MKKTILLTSLLASAQVYAAAQINYLNVDSEAVYFSTAEVKPTTAPQCAVAATNDRYAVSLNTKTGRAIYSLLITAMASKQSVSIESAQDCADIEGLERAKGVTIVPVVAAHQEENSTKPSILDNLREFSNSSLKFYHSGTTKYDSNEHLFFSEQFSRLGGKYLVVNTGGRKSIINVQGAGWLTSVLTPSITADDVPIKLEVIIDGTNYTFDMLSNNQDRWLLGDTSYATDANGYRHLEIARPHDVISKGRAVYFEQSLEVWVTMGQTPRSIGYESTSGVNYILSGPKPTVASQ